MSLIRWHKGLLQRFQDWLGISDYVMHWISFIEGVAIGILAYLFLSA